MKKKNKLKQKDFDEAFDTGNVTIDFSQGIKTHGLSQTVKLPPLTIPTWIHAEIEKISQLQANSRSSVIRQLLAEALQHRLQNLH